MRTLAATLALPLVAAAASSGCRAAVPTTTVAANPRLSSGVWGAPASAFAEHTCRDPDRLARVVEARDALARDAKDRGGVGAIVVEQGGECAVIVLFANDSEARAFAPAPGADLAGVPFRARAAAPDDADPSSPDRGAP